MSGSKVKVWVRTRPTSNFAHDNINLQPDGKTINIHCARDSKRGVVNNQILDWSFKLDGIFHNASQEQVMQTAASDIVQSALDGYNGTLMCYGQTGAGKTFTMTGATENYKHRGVIPRSLQQLFRDIEEKNEHAITVRISYLEIYNETMFDLLSTLPESMAQAQQAPMTVVEDENGVYVKGLSCHLAQNEEEALNLLFEGETNRAIATHTLNKNSSRSHCIFTVYIESRSRVSSNAKYTLSKINFVDLAGSERLGKTKSDGKTQQEAMYINKSLSFLEQTVIALADRRRDHVPFRQTKLTHCLKDSIGGNCNTLLVANVWGEATQLEETVSTLRFATRMMCVASEPAINEHYDPTIMVKKLEREITALKRELAMHDTLTNRSQITYEPLSEQQRYDIQQQVRSYVEGQVDEIDIVNVRQISGVYDAFRDLCHQMKQDIENDFKKNFTMIDKRDPSAIAAAKEAGVPIDEHGELVGESDGSSFGVGQAPLSARPGQSASVNAKRKELKRGRSKADKKDDKERISPGPKPSSPTQSTKGGAVTDGSTSQTPSGDKDDRRDNATPTSTVDDSRRVTIPPIRPSSPPPRAEKFEEFKQERGSEINRILVENKDTLGSKKKAYADLARQINLTKNEIDRCRVKLDEIKAYREEQGPMYNEDGDIIISEEEYLQIRKLKDLKNKYRMDFEELKNLKSEVLFCQKAVDQTRQRLIQEFDRWYSESFLSGPEGDVQASVDAGYGVRAGTQPPNKPEQVTAKMLEDEQEKFDRLQMELLMEHPDSMSYQNAKMRTQRRKTYEMAMMQPQGSRGPPPGTPTRIVKHHPPSMLQVQY